MEQRPVDVSGNGRPSPAPHPFTTPQLSASELKQEFIGTRLNSTSPNYEYKVIIQLLYIVEIDIRPVDESTVSG